MSTKENKQAQEDILKEQSEQTVDNTQTGTSEEEAVQASEAEEQIESEEAQELTAEEKLEKELETVKKLVEEQKDKYLRLSAEFDNYRKRTLKEKAELIKNGGEKAITSILPIWMTWKEPCRICRRQRM